MFFPFVPAFGPSRNFCAWLLTQNTQEPSFFFLSWKQGGMGDGDCFGGLVSPLEQSFNDDLLVSEHQRRQGHQGLELLEQHLCSF